MKNKLFLIALVIISLFLGYYYINTSLKSKVLKQLENNLKFCKVLKQKVTSLSSGKFWLICNGRPFYAELKDNKLSYELNGWSWLKETPYWNELKDCDVYNVHDNTAIFYCPVDFSSEPILKYFDISNPFSPKKIKEADFFETLLKDLSKNYPFLLSCSVTSYYAEGGKVPEMLLIEMKLRCDDGYYALITRLDSLMLPIYLNANDEEMVTRSFEKVFNVKPKVNGLQVSYDFDGWKINVTYDTTFKNFGRAKIYIILKDENSLKNLITKFIPFVGKNHPISLRQETEMSTISPYKIHYYKLGNHIVKIYYVDKKIFLLEKLKEGFYE